VPTSSATSTSSARACRCRPRRALHSIGAAAALNYK
jgi:hypothetical protein